LYTFGTMKNDAGTVSISYAIKRWREKHPSLVKKTVLSWIDDGLIECRKEKHGFTHWHTFTKKEVERVYKLLKPKTALGQDWRQQGLLPRPAK